MVLFTAAGVAGFLLYLLKKEKRVLEKSKPAKKKTTKTKKTKQNIGWELPKELPRNMSTVKIIAVERIDLAVNVVKLWLREAEGDKKP